MNRFQIADDCDFESLYRDHFEAIAEHAIARFELSSDLAEELAHEVLLAGIHHLGHVPDHRTWLLAAMASAASQTLKGRL